MTQTPRPLRRTLLSVPAACALVVGGVLSVGPGGLPSANLFSTYDAEVRARAQAPAGPPPITDPGAAAIAQVGGTARLDGHGHVHNDPTTKNAVSRSGEAAGAPDRTTPAQRAASRARVATQRTQREPRLVGVPLRSTRQRVPESVYAMAGGCYALGGQPLTFQATGLGSYLLYAPDRTFLAATASGGAAWPTSPSPDSDWTVREAGRGSSTFTLADGRCPAHCWRGCSPWGRRRPSRCAARTGAQRSPRSTRRQRTAVRRRHGLPGGPWLRRPARPRPDPRVPRRPGHLQPAVPQVRRRCRASRLPRPPGRGRPRRRARGRARRARPPAAATTRWAGRPSPRRPARTR